MKVLKILATPFIAIWRRIKETAWVQPLLIVGLIFGIIFSIPSITSWVKSWDFGSDTYTWLYNQQLSLEGIVGDDNKGAAYDFLLNFNKANSKWSENYKDEAKELMKDYVGNSNKMLLYFVQENDTCADINEASNYLVNDAWDSKVKKIDENAPDFRYKTIFTDQKIDVDDNDHTYDEHTPFELLMVDMQFYKFITTVRSAATTSNYYKNLESSSDKTTIENNIKKIGESTEYSSVVPYFVTIDLTDSNKSSTIVTNVFFKFDGSSKYEKADFLAQAWTNTEDFEAK